MSKLYSIVSFCSFLNCLSSSWLELEPRLLQSQCAVVTVLAYKVGIIAESRAHSYRPYVL